MSEASNGRLAGKTAVVTGSGKGIGKGVARLFASQGARVMVTARTESDVQGVIDQIRETGGTAQGHIADIGSPEGIERLVAATIDAFGGVDILVHNAGIFPHELIEEMPDESLRRVLDVNLTSAFRLVKACIPHMKVQGGRMLFTSSVQGNKGVLPGCAHYAASKAGLTGLIRTAAVELARYQITVNGVEPGMILTEGVERAIKPDRRDKLTGYVPLGRWGLPDDVARAMLFLASEDAGYITGQTLVVDGGATLPFFPG
jgi:3-oxoacyl-[acyl-carrier protein] reductase